MTPVYNVWAKAPACDQKVLVWLKNEGVWYPLRLAVAADVEGHPYADCNAKEIFYWAGYHEKQRGRLVKETLSWQCARFWTPMPKGPTGG